MWFDRYNHATYNLDFDGMKEARGKGDTYARNFIAKRLAEHAGINYDPFSSSVQYHPTFAPEWLKWNKNPQCPPDIWKKISVPLVPTSKKTFKGLAVQRHSKVKSTLDNINHIELSFSINNDIDIGYGFWLIDDQYEDFVYAILKSSMFRAWCELTVNSKGHSHHFTIGMWDIFPLPKLTESQKSAIIIAGQKLRKRWPWAQGELDKLVDGLFVPAPLSQFLTNVDRKQILTEGFLDAFYGV